MDRAPALVGGPQVPLELTGGSVQLHIEARAVRLFVHERADFPGSRDTVNALKDAFERCKRCQSRPEVLFIGMFGPREPHCIPSVTQSVAEKHALCVLELLREHSHLQLPVVGLADGCLSPLGSCICVLPDVLVTTAATQFHLPGHTADVNSTRLQRAGLVSEIADDAAALLAQSHELHGRLLEMPIAELMQLRRRKQEAWNQFLGLHPEGVVAEITPAPETSREPTQQEPIYTLMLSNLPCKVSHCQVADAIDGLGFALRYDLLHVIAGRKTAVDSRSNLGYGFINFLTPEDAEAFATAFNGYRFEGTASLKRSKVRPARVQGFTNTMELLKISFAKRNFRGSLMCLV